MLTKANQIKEKLEKTNVSFIKSDITNMSVLEPGIADCIISNCVINLVPSEAKHLAFKEAFRLLKRGGRLAVSDILTKKPLRKELRSDIAMYVGCISGASTVDEYQGWLEDAGFKGKWTSNWLESERMLLPKRNSTDPRD
jgi:arsenite methyltransferase